MNIKQESANLQAEYDRQRIEYPNEAEPYVVVEAVRKWGQRFEALALELRSTFGAVRHGKPFLIVIQEGDADPRLYMLDWAHGWKLTPQMDAERARMN